MKKMVAVTIVLAQFLSFAGCKSYTARKELNSKGISYETAAFFACATRGDKDVVALFLQAGMDPNVRDGRGSTALWEASKSDRSDVVNLLAESGAQRGYALKAVYDDLRGGDSGIRPMAYKYILASYEAGSKKSFKSEEVLTTKIVSRLDADLNGRDYTSDMDAETANEEDRAILAALRAIATPEANRAIEVYQENAPREVASEATVENCYGYNMIFNRHIRNLRISVCKGRGTVDISFDQPPPGTTTQGVRADYMAGRFIAAIYDKNGQLLDRLQSDQYGCTRSWYNNNGIYMRRPGMFYIMKSTSNSVSFKINQRDIGYVAKVKFGLCSTR
jgi:hypothetical protein